MARRDFVGIYKPKKAIKGGSVVQFKLGSERDCMFMELAPQVRPMNDKKPYDWENSRVSVKLGAGDVGKLMALLNGILPTKPGNEPDLELFHKNENGHKVIKIKRQERGYYLKVLAKNGSKNLAVAVPISWDEAELVKIALKRGYEIMLGW